MPRIKPAFRPLPAIILAVASLACPDGAQSLPRDGYYTAEADRFDGAGWKERLAIRVRDGLIISAEYGSRNAGGFPRSWDMADRRLSSLNRIPPQSRYARAFAAELLDRQNPAKISSWPGALRAGEHFKLLAEAALARARAGDGQIAFVSLSDLDSPE